MGSAQLCENVITYSGLIYYFVSNYSANYTYDVSGNISLFEFLYYKYLASCVECDFEAQTDEEIPLLSTRMSGFSN